MQTFVTLNIDMCGSASLQCQSVLPQYMYHVWTEPYKKCMLRISYLSLLSHIKMTLSKSFTTVYHLG